MYLASEYRLTVPSLVSLRVGLGMNEDLSPGRKFGVQCFMFDPLMMLFIIVGLRHCNQKVLVLMSY